MPDHYVFADGRYITRIYGLVWRLFTIDGQNICTLTEEHIDYGRPRPYRT